MESLTREQKEQRWQEMAARVDKITDTLGMPVDEGIKETVIVLNLLGFPTVQSCEGHAERGVCGPWVDMRPKGTEALAQKRSQAIDRLIKARQQKQPEEESVEQILKEVDEAAREPMTHLAENLIARLTAFYQEHQTPYDCILMIHHLGLGYRLECQGTSMQYGPFALPRKDERLPHYQQEMRSFTDFLKARYFTD
jgi:hypothetical protein